MLGEGYLVQWENAALELDEKGVSEQYFPLWGYTDPDEYLKESNALREQNVRPRKENATPLARDAAGSSRGLFEGDLRPSALNDVGDTNYAKRQETAVPTAASAIAPVAMPEVTGAGGAMPQVGAYQRPSLGKRFAWSLGSFAGRVLVIVVASLLLTALVGLATSGLSLGEYAAQIGRMIARIFGI